MTMTIIILRVFVYILYRIGKMDDHWQHVQTLIFSIQMVANLTVLIIKS